MRPVFCLLSALTLVCSGCGSLEEIDKGGSDNGVQEASIDVEEQGGATEAVQNSGTPICLSDCDNGNWKYLNLSEVRLPDFTVPDGCLVTSTQSFPSVSSIDVITVLNCSMNMRALLWSMDTTGKLLKTPVEMARCSNGTYFSVMRRVAGRTGTLTFWSCSKADNYPVHEVRIENPEGVVVFSYLFAGKSINFQNRDVSYDPDSGIWGLALGSEFRRFSVKGMLPGITVLPSSNYNYVNNVSVRYGVFELTLSGSNIFPGNCSRISRAGALLCNYSPLLVNSSSATPVSGSSWVLSQEGKLFMIGADSEATCTAFLRGQTNARHMRAISLLTAARFKDTPYIGALAKDGDDLVLAIFSYDATTAQLQHIASNPLGRYTTSERLEFIDGKLFVFWIEEKQARVVALPIITALF